MGHDLLKPGDPVALCNTMKKALMSPPEKLRLRWPAGQVEHEDEPTSLSLQYRVL